MTTTHPRDAALPETVPAAEFATPRVVVTVDSRPASLDALAWAADEALIRGMSLRMVTAFADPDRGHAPRTVEQAMDLQRRLRDQLEPSRPWIEGAQLVVRRGSVLTLLGEATGCGDILVLGKSANAGAVGLTYQPVCPVVVVPAQPIAPADG
jgi:hypothetical protein